MNAQDVLELYTLLGDHGVQLWLDGGWGIDALLGRQTRSHKDLINPKVIPFSHFR